MFVGRLSCCNQNILTFYLVDFFTKLITKTNGKMVLNYLNVLLKSDRILWLWLIEKSRKNDSIYNIYKYYIIPLGSIPGIYIQYVLLKIIIHK